MREVEVKVRGRDKKAAEAWRFLDWYFRKNRKGLREKVKQAMVDSVLYGVARKQEGAMSKILCRLGFHVWSLYAAKAEDGRLVAAFYRCVNCQKKRKDGDG